jgi:4-amino-4-deoxy-L-arabinose transferase-like glycosyltransferase
MPCGRPHGVSSLAVGRHAWIAVALTLTSFALTCWWLSQDRAMPYGDAAEHLYTAFGSLDATREGHWLVPFTVPSVYPPLIPLFGALFASVGGRAVAAPVLGQNVVFLPLLAGSCYGTAKRAYGDAAGPLAVAFALGGPLVTEQFHVFMLDAPLTALVAATIWLLTASERFRRRDIAATAGLGAGLGLLSKQAFALYVTGFVAIVLLRGGWRHRQGVACFLLAALVVALPWYAYHGSHLSTFIGAAGTGPTVPPLARPPLLSIENAEWYFWALANGLLFVPLLAFASIGVASSLVAVTRARERSSMVPELLGGLALAWVAITVMPHHDVRYTMPLVVFLAVLGTGWIVRLPRAPRLAATVALAGAVVAAALGATFGVGHRGTELLPGNRSAPRGEGVPPLHRLTVYANRDFMVSQPRRGGDVLDLMKDLRRAKVTRVLWFESTAPLWYVDFNANGLLTFARIARLYVPSGAIDFGALDERSAFLINARSFGTARPCTRLSRGQALWIRLGNPFAPGARDYCPRFRRRFYGP